MNEIIMEDENDIYFEDSAPTQKSNSPDGMGRLKNQPPHRQYEILTNKISGFRLMLDSSGQGYIVIPQKGYLSPVHIEGIEFDNYLTLLAEKNRILITISTRKMIKALLRAKCQDHGEKIDIALRMGGFKRDGEKELYVDLANEARQVARVTADGWDIIDEIDSPVMFRRTRDMLPMPLPVVLNKGERKEVWKEFHDVLQPGSMENWVKMVAWVIGAFRAPIAPYVGISINGQEDSGKTQRSRMLRTLVDPHVMELVGEIRARTDFEPIVNNTFALAFENISHIPDWMSDALCTIATRGIFPVRTLFTTMDVTVIVACRPMLINGITDFIQRPDLKRRFMFCDLPPFSVKGQPGTHKVDDELLAARFEALRPRLLGAILDAVSCSFRHENDEEIRALDWGRGIANFGIAVAAAERGRMLPWPGLGRFHKLYFSAAKAVSGAVIETVLAQSVLALLKECERKFGQDYWQGDVNNLYLKLTDIATWQNIAVEDVLRSTMMGEDGYFDRIWTRDEAAAHIAKRTSIFELREFLPEPTRDKLDEKGRKWLRQGDWPENVNACARSLKRCAAALETFERVRIVKQERGEWLIERIPKVVFPEI